MRRAIWLLTLVIAMTTLSAVTLASLWAAGVVASAFGPLVSLGFLLLVWVLLALLVALASARPSRDR